MSLPLPEIQGLLVSGYQKQRAACYLLLRVTDREAARAWLAGILPRVTFCDQRGRDQESKLNVAVSHHGLAQLGCPADELAGFAREFREGMVTAHRQRVLGDLAGSRSDPVQWLWGGPRHTPVDVLLMVFERDAAALEEALTRTRGGLRGVEILRELPTTPLKDYREHFGFRDGIAQPVIRGLGRDGPPRDRVAPGEFILGHTDERGAAEPVPPLGVNGTYLVFRQLMQDVPAFWRALGELPDADRIALAAKMVGRWPDGTPLTVSPCPAASPNPTNDFAYKAADDAGLRCPFGAHIRRANPRDDLFDNAGQSQRMANRHRLLRRGRSFGLPVAPEIYPAGCAVEAEPGAGDSPDGRGIYFICLNASLSRQFEFVQQTWIDNPKFSGLSTGVDVVAGGPRVPWPGMQSTFTAQSEPVRRRTRIAENHVHTAGGEYFFLPARTALQSIAAGAGAQVSRRGP